MEKVKIVLTEDHEIVRDGIKALIHSYKNMEVIGEASNGKELIDILKNELPDVAIIDISLPDTSGIELTSEISEKYPSVNILILSMYTEEEFIFNALKAGAIGYLPKNTSREELRDAIIKVKDGIEYFPESISNIILKSYVKKAKQEKNDDNTKDINVLSKREKEVLVLFLEGISNIEIAQKLFISTRTVESHKNHIMNKLELKSNVDLIKFAIQNNIIEI